MELKVTTWDMDNDSNSDALPREMSPEFILFIAELIKVDDTLGNSILGLSLRFNSAPLFSGL